MEHAWNASFQTLRSCTIVQQKLNINSEEELVQNRLFQKSRSMKLSNMFMHGCCFNRTDTKLVHLYEKDQARSSRRNNLTIIRPSKESTWQIE